MMRRVAVVVVVVLWAQAVWAQLLYRNAGGSPYMPTQDAAWTSGNCLVVDSGGNTASWGSCGGVGSGITGLTADSGGSTTGTAVTLAGGTNGIDTSRSADTVTFNVDTTEIGTTTFGAGSGVVWTFDASAGTDSTITFGNGTVNVSTGLQQGGTAVALQSRSISTTSPLSGGGDLSSDRTLSITANGIGPTQIDETANYSWSGINLQTSGSLNFGNNAGALILPNNTTGACDTATTEGQICWSTSDLLKVGTSSGVKTFVDTDSTQVLSNKSHDETSTSTALANVDNFSATITADPASASSSGFRSIYANATSSSAQTVLALVGVRGDGTWAGSSANTSGLVVGVQGFATKTSTGALGTLYGLYASVGNTNGTGAVTNAYGLYVADSTTTGTITNDWAIYTAGSEKSRFGGSLGVGGDPTARLHVNAAASGDEVARFETTTTGADPRYSIYNFRGTTSGAASTTFDLPTTSDRTYVIEFVVGALCTNNGGGCTTGQAGGWISRAVYKNVAGTLTEVNETNSYAQDDITGTITTPAVAVSGTNIRLTCTGLASQTNTWVVTFKVQEMGA